MDRHPNIPPPGNKPRRKSSTDDREIFAWRKYDNLLDRVPGDDLHHLPPTGPPPPPPGPPTHPPHPPIVPPEGIRGRSKSFSFPPGRHRSRESTNEYLERLTPTVSKHNMADLIDWNCTAKFRLDNVHL